MNRTELIQYMSMVMDMEKHCYMQQELIAKLQTLTKGLGYKKVFSEPIKPTKRKIGVGDFFVYFIFALLGGGILCIPVGFLIAFILEQFFSPEYNSWPLIRNMTSPWQLYIDVGIFLSFLFFIKGAIKDISNARKKYTSDKKLYEEQLAQYNYDVASDRRRGLKELTQKRFLEKEIQILTSRHLQSEQLLAELYGLNIIYPKYRNFVAVSTMLEYLQSGRCTALEGHEGAYNIFETESRLDKIILKLDDVIRQLSRIASSQMLLYAAIQESNQKLNGLIDSTSSMANYISSLTEDVSAMTYNIEQIGTNSAIAAYNADRIATEVRFRNIKDNIYSYI